MPLVTGPCKTAIFAGENFGNALKCRCRVNLKPRTYDCRETIIDMVQCQLLPHAVLAFAERADPPSHRRQRAHRPHQLLGRHALAMQRGAVGFEEVATTGGAAQLAPGSTARMTIGAEVPTARPPRIGTLRGGAEVRRRVHLARAAARGYEA